MRKIPDTLEGTTSHVGIIGGGIAGVTTALGLADKGYQVSLFEAAAETLQQTSDATPCRLGVGFHYMDKETALLNLEATIELIKYLKKTSRHSFQVFENFTENLIRTKKIIYVISKQSLVKTNEVLNIFNILKSRYKELIDYDKDNEVLGSVGSFYKLLKKDQYKNTLNTKKISTLIETCETLFDWPLFKIHLYGKLYSNKNIAVHVNKKVRSIKRLGDFKSEINFHDNEKCVFDFIVNCSWMNVDRINETAGYANNLNTINRVKCMAVVKLTKNIANKSFMIGYGPFCSLSSRPDGIGYLTYEPVTNIDQFDSKTDVKKEIKCIEETMKPDKQKELGNAIIKGSLEYIPGLEGCELITLKTGIVRTDAGTVNIYEKGSHFKRVFKGVYAFSLGLMVNESRKHTYWCVNMQHILRLVDCQEYFRREINKLYGKIPQELNARIILSILKHDFLVNFLEEDNIDSLKKRLPLNSRHLPLLFKNKHAMHDELLKKTNHQSNAFTL